MADATSVATTLAPPPAPDSDVDDDASSCQEGSPKGNTVEEPVFHAEGQPVSPLGSADGQQCAPSRVPLGQRRITLPRSSSLHSTPTTTSFTTSSRAYMSVFGRASREASWFSWKDVAINNITFDDPELLRGSFSAHTLRQWGLVLDQKQGASDWYDWTAQADHLDVFISHNWSMPRKDKFLILALHLNLRAAIICTAVVVVVTALLIVYGILPSYYLLNVKWWSPWCQVFGSGVFLFVLLCWQEVGRISPWRGQLLFLDKACINQYDDDLKRNGIEHLAAFVYYSWSMLICYSDEYLQRLWTVYEVVHFMLLHPGSALHVRHAFFAKFVIVAYGVVFLYDICWHVLHVPGILDYTFVSVQVVSGVLTVLCMVPVSVTVSIMLMTMTRKRMRISERMKQFRFDEAKCFCEDDRAIVKRNIIAAMKHNGRADTKGSDAEIIGELEGLVHTEVPKLLSASLGRVGFPYHLGVCGVLPYCLQTIDYACAQLCKSTPSGIIWVELLRQMTMVFAGVPLCLALGIQVAECVLSPTRPRYGRNLILLTILFILFLGGSYALLRELGMLAIQGSALGVAVFVALVAVYALSTFFIYRPIGYDVHHRRLR